MKKVKIKYVLETEVSLFEVADFRVAIRSKIRQLENQFEAKIKLIKK